MDIKKEIIVVEPFYIDDGVAFGQPNLIGSRVHGDSLKHVYSFGSKLLLYADGPEYVERFKHQPITEDMIGYSLYHDQSEGVYISSISFFAYGQEIEFWTKLFFEESETDETIRKKLYKRFREALNVPDRSFLDILRAR